MFSTFDWSSGVLWVDLGSLLAAGAVGALGGRLAAGWLGGGRLRLTRASTIIARLQDLTANVASDVGQHSTRVQQIGSALSAARESGHGSLEDMVLSSVAEILTANERLSQQLESATVQLQRQAAEIESQALVARTDPLTNLANRRAFDDELVRRLAEWQRRHIVVSLVMMDVDHFKRVNDSYGHQAGDEVLRNLASVLKNTMREMDLVARYGGEEFAIVLPVTRVIEAIHAADRARRAIASHRARYEGTDIQVTASFGVTEVGLGDDSAAFVRRADEALYASKQAGRNCVHFHDGQRCHPANDAESLSASDDSTVPAPIVATSPGVVGASPANAAQPRSASTNNAGAATATATSPGGRSQVHEKLADFCDSLRGRMAQSRQQRAPLSLILVDVDNYKSLIEKLGPAVGDLVLQTMSEFLLASLSERDFIAPYGPGQFAAALPATDLASALRIAEGLRSAIAGCSVQIKGAPTHFTISLGVAEALPTDDSSSLIKRADAALFASKAAGRNCSHFHNGEACEPARSLVGAG